MGLQNRCRYIKGDMFEQAPSADLYLMKMILHDWNDDECIEILSNMHKSASDKSKVFIIESYSIKWKIQSTFTNYLTYK